MTDSAKPLQTHDDHDHSDHDHAAHVPEDTQPPSPIPAGVQRFRIATMDCAAEESEIRRAVEPIEGIRGLNFQLGARVLGIDAPTELMPKILTAIREAGFDPQEVKAKEGAAQAIDDELAQSLGTGFARLIAALGFALGAESISFFAPKNGVVLGTIFGFGFTFWTLLGMALAAIAIGLAGLSTYKKGWFALRNGNLNINALMTVAVTGAFIIGQWPEAAMVMALYAIAELIEAKAVDRARNSIKGLLALTPETAEVQRADGSWQVSESKSVAINNVVRIKPGERVPLDGIVTKGNSAINQAPVTGESIPVDKTIGDPVFAGTINESGALEFKVTAIATNSTLARIIEAVEKAQNSRAPTQRFVDQFAAIYTPAVFVLAIAVAILFPLFGSATWLEAAYKALVLLVIACPCALVISTPVTVVSGLSAAAKQGILIKGGVYLEEARKIKAIALDKTGTITEGKPKLLDWQLIATDAKLDKTQIERIALGLASSSDHPVSLAIARGLSNNETQNRSTANTIVEGFTALVGRGVQATVDGKAYVLGNHRLIKERG
jgi:Zn2+/Cd2+-exporting ATPase